MARKKKFKTEVQQLLDLVIHSLYSKKEIFLRELISNASDAIDRARFLSLSDKGILEEDADWKIKITTDSEARTITVSDNGIGMDQEEVEKNIGTIANSGTRRFLEEIEKGNVADTPDLIGQFGVGFYASFMVSDNVKLVTRRVDAAADAAVCWESTGDGSYRIDACTKETRGTDVVLTLREGVDEYLEDWNIRKTVKTYSDYVAYPIAMDVTTSEPQLDDEGKPIEGAEPVETTSEETLNTMKAIWKRPKSEVSEDEYKGFYKALTHDYNDPAETIPFAAEGKTEFKALLYLPSKVPWDLFSREERKGIHLYVRNIFITDDCKELLPEYMRFVKGVVDSSDLPLNVSREILQDDAIIRRINKSLVGKVLSTLKDLKDKRPDDYLAFYIEFGKVLKEGLHMDFANQEKLRELVMFESSKTEAGKFVTLKEYCDRMPSAQKEIYYLAADDRAAAEASPVLEIFREKDYEVLFMTDPIDEWVVQSLTEYDDKKLCPVDRGDIDLEEEGEEADKKKKKKKEAAAKKYEGLLGVVQEKLKDEVKEVRLSDRLTESACCLVADGQAMGAHMERVFKAMNQEFAQSQRILELNPSHPILKIMQGLHAKDAEDARLGDYVDLLYNQALLLEGSPIKDPLHFAKLVSGLMVAQGETKAKAK